MSVQIKLWGYHIHRSPMEEQLSTYSRCVGLYGTSKTIWVMFLQVVLPLIHIFNELLIFLYLSFSIFVQRQNGAPEHTSINRSSIFLFSFQTLVWCVFVCSSWKQQRAKAFKITNPKQIICFGEM